MDALCARFPCDGGSETRRQHLGNSTEIHAKQSTAAGGGTGSRRGKGGRSGSSGSNGGAKGVLFNSFRCCRCCRFIGRSLPARPVREPVRVCSFAALAFCFLSSDARFPRRREMDALLPPAGKLCGNMEGEIRGRGGTETTIADFEAALSALVSTRWLPLFSAQPETATLISPPLSCSVPLQFDASLPPASAFLFCAHRLSDSALYSRSSIGRALLAFSQRPQSQPALAHPDSAVSCHRVAGKWCGSAGM